MEDESDGVMDSTLHFAELSPFQNACQSEAWSFSKYFRLLVNLKHFLQAKPQIGKHFEKKGENEKKGVLGEKSVTLWA